MYDKLSLLMYENHTYVSQSKNETHSVMLQKVCMSLVCLLVVDLYAKYFFIFILRVTILFLFFFFQLLVFLANPAARFIFYQKIWSKSGLSQATPILTSFFCQSRSRSSRC